jgi:type I restriction enzyme S subunit
VKLDRQKAESLFIQYWLQGSNAQNQISSSKSLAAQPNLFINSIERLRCPLPATVFEQRAIATALGDVDALLGALERLIAKKRDLKQAAMQQLLTGKTRLPGFSGEWEVRRLGDIAHIKTGSRNNEDKLDDGKYPFFVRSDVVERINSFSYDCEAILVPGEGRIGSIFHYIRGRFDVHQRVYAITQFKWVWLLWNDAPNGRI